MVLYNSNRSENFQTEQQQIRQWLLRAITDQTMVIQNNNRLDNGYTEH